MISFYEASDILRQEREAQEEAERKRKEEECRKEDRRQLVNEEIDRTLTLGNLSEDYDIACKIKRYLAVVEASGSLDPKTMEWIEWAKAEADWYDLLIMTKLHDKEKEATDLPRCTTSSQLTTDAAAISNSNIRTSAVFLQSLE